MLTIKVFSPPTSFCNFVDKGKHVWAHTHVWAEFQRTWIAASVENVFGLIWDVNDRWYDDYSMYLRREVKEYGLETMAVNWLVTTRNSSPEMMQTTWRVAWDGLCCYVAEMGEDGGGRILKLANHDGGCAVEMFAAGCRDSKLSENFWLEKSRSIDAMRRWFLKHKDISDWGDDDGRSVAEDFMLVWRGGDARKGVERLLLEVKGIRQACKRDVWLRPLLETVIENKLRVGSDCFLGALEIGAEEGRTIGVSLASALATTLTAEAAVDEWVCRFPALGEYEKENAWFRSFFNFVAKSLFNRAVWGLKMRVAVGCVLSVVDVGSDIWMIFKYMEMEEIEKNSEGDKGGEWKDDGFGPNFFLWATIYCIALSMFHQLVVVITVNRKNPLVLLREIIIVLLGIKPVFDAYRVTQNATKEGKIIDVMGEMVITRR